MDLAHLKRIAVDPRNPKSVKQAALNQMRALEARAGIESVPYNSAAFNA